MKNIIKFLAIAATVSFAASCDLSEYNPNTDSDANSFKTVQSVQEIVNDFYMGWPKIDATYNQEIGYVDYIITGSLNARYLPDYSPLIQGNWGGWGSLRDLNYFLYMLRSSACTLTDAQKDEFEGEARFFRARWYFERLRNYGDLPWFDHIVQGAEEWKDRDSRDLIIKKMNEDFDYAYAHVTRTSADGTNLNKFIVKFVQMQANLYEASFRKYNDVTTSVLGVKFSNYTVNDLYKIAADAAKEIMDNSSYGLVSDYRSLFTSETILTDEVLLGAATDNVVMGSQNQYFNFGGMSLTRPFINIFLNADGTPYTDKAGFETEKWKDEFTGRDPRLKATVRYPGYKFTSKGVESVAVPNLVMNVNCSGYQVIKFSLDKSLDQTGLDETGGLNKNCVPVHRYAEVLLSYAEAKAELGEMTDAIWAETIGALRKRAGITGGLTTQPTKVDTYLQSTFYPNVSDPVILEIRRERMVELFDEGLRPNDILRWGCGKCLKDVAWEGMTVDGYEVPVDIDGDGTNDYYFSSKAKGEIPVEYQSIYVVANQSLGLQVVANGSTYKLSYKVDPTSRYWSDERILYAISQSEISKYEHNGGHLTQNPGY